MAESGNKISVGCKLPQGCIMETGYKVVGGGVIRGEKYQRVALAGANQHAIIQGIMRTPSPASLMAGITDNVDESMFDEWAKTAGAGLVKRMIVYKAKNHADAVAIGNEMFKEKIGMEAVDPSAHPGISKRTEGDSAQAA